MKKFLLLLIFTTSVLANDFPDINLPSYGKYKNCKIDMSCDSVRNCSSFPLKKDSRNCKKCLIKTPFGGCTLRGNDPLCEAAKSAQSAIYQADHVSRKLDCERLKAASLAVCNIEKSALENQCIVEKQIEEEGVFKMIDKFNKLSLSVSKAKPMNLSKTLVSDLERNFGSDALKDLIFYQYSDFESFFSRVTKYFTPNKFIEKSELVSILGVELKAIYSYSNFTLVDSKSYLKIEDVIRAMYTNQAFDKYKKDGIATLESSEQVNLSNTIDELVIISCEKLQNDNSIHSCSRNAELYL
jgi:hypothetical protein